MVAPWPTALEKGCFALSDFIHSWKWEYLDRVWSNTSALSGWGMRGLARLARKTFQFSLILAVKSRFLPLLWWHPVCTSWQLWATRHPIVGSMAFYELLKMLWEPGFLSYAPGSESAHMFHLSHFHRLVRFCWFGLVVGAVCLFCFCFLVVYWPTCSIELSTDDYFSISSWLPLSLWRAQHSPKKKSLPCWLQDRVEALPSAIVTLKLLTNSIHTSWHTTLIALV